MKLLVETLLNGGLTSLEVVEADSVPGAMNKSRGFALENGHLVANRDEIGVIGVYEVGSINLLDSVDKVCGVHSFYRGKLKELGYDPSTFEKIAEETK